MAALDFFTVAQQVLNCAYDGVDHDSDLAINRRCVVAGEIAWDDCQCGQLVISEDRRYPSRLFPLEEVDHAAECGEPWIVAVFTLSLTRCVPGVDQNGNPPSCEDITVAAQQLSKDKDDIRNAVMCCLSTLYDLYDLGVDAFQLGAQETVGPAGQCAGSELQILIGRTNDCGCG